MANATYAPLTRATMDRPMQSFSARERAALEQMDADWSPLPAGVSSPEVSDEDLAPHPRSPTRS